MLRYGRGYGHSAEQLARNLFPSSSSYSAWLKASAAYHQQGASGCAKQTDCKNSRPSPR